MERKAVALLSGGLDSILAIKLMLLQGITIEALNFSAVFCTCAGSDESHTAEKAARALGVPLVIIDFTKEFLQILEHPRYGYGANANPCIDCRIFMLKKAAAYMREHGASFLVTGEVVGERPMSQRRDALQLIDKAAGLTGLVVRPLSAQELEPTIPEREGVVDRQKLLAIHGRSRRPQIALASELGITDYPNPAGGCLLTDPAFGKRVKDLIGHQALDVDNLKLLTVGRHFRLGAATKLAVGRNERENDMLEAIGQPGDVYFKLQQWQGPIGLLRGVVSPALIEQSARIVAYHTKHRADAHLAVEYWHTGEPVTKILTVAPAVREEFDSLRI